MMLLSSIGAVAVLLVIGLGLAPATQAQIIAHGSCWIQRNSEQPTWLHANEDPLCLLQFPAACYRGMMMPEWLYCDFRVMPRESMPRGCAAAYEMHMRNPQGGCMMTGGMTFRFDLSLTLHYDPQSATALGIPSANLVLIRRASAGYEIVAEAEHDPQAALFRLTTPMPSEWYGVADRSNLPVAVESSSWGMLKAAYR